MTNTTKLLLMILIMWMKESNPCFLSLHVKTMNKLRRAEEQRQELDRLRQEWVKLEDEERKQYALYQEEKKLRKNKPEYFPEGHKDIGEKKVTDFSEFLPEDYGYTGD